MCLCITRTSMCMHAQYILQFQHSMCYNIQYDCQGYCANISLYIQCHTGQLLLAPTSGTVLGGTPIRVYGPCVQNPKDIKCVFDTKEVEGQYYPDRGQFVCVTPMFQETGRVQFTLTFTSDNGEEQSQTSSFSIGKLLFITESLIEQ